ncbi:MAG: MoaD/ThiS family protein [Planctomycetota bacterium]
MTRETRTTVRMEVLLFGPQAALAKVRALSIEVVPGETTCADALRELGEACEFLRDSLPASRLAVNHALVDADVVLRGDEALALIGMVGGG